jgi:hypothetical protein
MAGSGNYHNPSTHPRLGTGVQYHDPDMDSPWWCHNVTLPNDARCETCAHWECIYGTCGVETQRVTMPESRCMSWQRNACQAKDVEARAAKWDKREVERDRREQHATECRLRTRRLRVESNATR